MTNGKIKAMLLAVMAAVFGENLTAAYFLGLFFMIIGTIFVVADTLMDRHTTH